MLSSFTEQKFREIGFPTTSQSEYVCVYGTRLMAQTKLTAMKLMLTFFLVCADKNVVPYFKKQRFSKISLHLIDGWDTLRIMMQWH